MSESVGTLNRNVSNIENRWYYDLWLDILNVFLSNSSVRIPSREMRTNLAKCFHLKISFDDADAAKCAIEGILNCVRLVDAEQDLVGIVDVQFERRVVSVWSPVRPAKKLLARTSGAGSGIPNFFQACSENNLLFIGHKPSEGWLSAHCLLYGGGLV